MKQKEQLYPELPVTLFTTYVVFPTYFDVFKEICRLFLCLSGAAIFWAITFLLV